MVDNALTITDKHRTILCVKSVRCDLAIRRLDLETFYLTNERYDAEIEQKIEDLSNSIAYYDELIEKLNNLMY